MPIVAGAVDPHNPRHVAIGSSRGALRISDDGDATWRAATAAGRGSEVVTISFDPDNPTVIYAGTLTDGLSASIDDGASFGHIGPLLRGQAVQALMWDPAPASAAGVRAARAAAGQRGFLAALSGRVGGVGRTSFRPSRPLLTKPGSTQARTGQKPTCDAGNWQAADTITTQITIAGPQIKDTTTVPARMVGAAISCAVKARNAFATVRLTLTGAVIGKPYARARLCRDR